MGVKLGIDGAYFRLGTNPAKVFLGDVTIQDVPGAPEIALAEASATGTDLRFVPPTDGGSAITGYKFYFNSVQKTPISGPAEAVEPGQLIVLFDEVFAGQEAEVSASNAIGEGPASETVTVVDVS